MMKRTGKLPSRSKFTADSQPKLQRELALLIENETCEERIKSDRGQFLRLPANKCQKLTLKKIESYYQEAKESHSRSQSISKSKQSTLWLETIIQVIVWRMSLRRLIVKRKSFCSNVVPQHSYLKKLEGVMATCLGHPCTGGFIPISALCEGDPPRQSCAGCALAEQLKTKSDHSVAGAESDRPLELKQLVEQDVEFVKEIAKGSDGIVSTVLWRNGTYIRKQFNHIKEFKREQEVAMKVSHPNIVHCFGSSPNSIDPSDYYLFMEFLEEDLESFLNDIARTRSQLSFQEALDVLMQISEAMKHLHEKNFVHGDLKPSNILVSKLAMPHSGVQFLLIKVADFGRAQRSDSTAFDLIIGTRFYTAPEVLRCRQVTAPEYPHKINHPKKIDVYSFGVIAYQVLSGLTISRLYKGFPSQLYGEGVLKSDYDGRQWRPNRIWNEISQPLERVCLEPDHSLLLPLIERCWASSPEDRPTFLQICQEIHDLY